MFFFSHSLKLLLSVIINTVRRNSHRAGVGWCGCPHLSAMKCRRAWRQLLFVKVLFVLLSLAKCVDSALASNRIRGSATLSKTSLKRHSAAASNLQHFRVMASHQDQYRDTFPISLSPSMYNRVMEMRKLMRLQFDDVDDLRGTTPVCGAGLL